LSALINH